MDWSSVSFRVCSFFIIVSVAVSAVKVDYCNVFSCGKDHIACNNNGSYSKLCPSNRRMVHMRPLKSLILHLHNSKRNETAGGNRKLHPAVRMATMVWDNELAKMAELLVKSCDLNTNKHECRSLPRFRYSGKNNGIYRYRGSEDTVKNDWIVENLIGNWIAESENTTMKVIRKYPSVRPKPEIGHFTLIISESNTSIGCAAIRFKRRGTHFFLLNCNYATTNIIGQRIYRSGKAPSTSCKKGHSSKYRNLCSTREVYDTVSP